MILIFYKGLDYRHINSSVWTINTIHSSVQTIDTYTLVSGLQTHTFQCLDYRRVHSSVAKIQELERKAHREQNNAKFIFIMATFLAIYIANQCAKMSILRAKPQSAKECNYAHRSAALSTMPVQMETIFHYKRLLDLFSRWKNSELSTFQNRKTTIFCF